MPYGISKALGGDSPENVARVKQCVQAILREQPHMEEEGAIRICKRQMERSMSIEKAKPGGK